jgi:hypothetical protein
VGKSREFNRRRSQARRDISLAASGMFISDRFHGPAHPGLRLISMKYFSDFCITYRREIGAESKRLVSKLSNADFDGGPAPRMRIGIVTSNSKSSNSLRRR